MLFGMKRGLTPFVSRRSSTIVRNSYTNVDLLIPFRFEKISALGPGY